MTILAKQIVLLTLLLLLAPSVRADLQERRAELSQIRQQIEQTQQDLEKKQQSEQRFSRKLALLNRSLKRLDKQVAGLKQEQRRLQQQIGEQQQRLKTDKSNIRTVGRRLEKRLVALYKEGESGPLKILFSADSPTELVQQYQYLTRVMQYDQDLLGEYRAAVERHQQGLAELEQLNRQKLALLEQQQQQRDLAADGKRLQARLLKRVKKEQKLLKQDLAQLQEQAERLQGLIKQLQQPDQDAGFSPGANAFASEKSKLNWPVNGVVLIGFGTQKDKSLGTYYESNGLEIGIPPGTSIRAVADGKVVFADWFKGYGNLLILSHPGGFHTLYAQADELNKAVGEHVEAGAVVGQSGLNGRDSIYFEIRQNGSPVDPLQWLQRR